MYFVLDLLVTIVHKWVLTRCIVTSLCREKRGNYANWFPYAFSMLATCLSTWVVQSPECHLLIGLLGDIFAVKLSYKDSIYKVLICAFLPQAINLSTESAILIIASRVTPQLFVLTRGWQFGIWPVYGMDIVLPLIAAYSIRRALRDFQYQINFRDFIIIFVCYLPGFALSQAMAVEYLGTGTELSGPFEWLLGAVLGIVFTIVLLGMKNQIYLREKMTEYKIETERLEQQYAYYQSRQADEERIRALYHDMKNHLLLLKNQEGQEQARTAEQLLTQISDYEDYQQTGNDFLNVILRDKARKARECQADFKCSVRFEDGAFIEPLDISTIFGNALDNAIEAVEKLPVGERMITVKAGRVQDMLVIVFENTCSGNPDRKSSKADRFLHGFGILNIKRVAEKYGGECTIHGEGGKFVMKIILPVP